MATIIPIGNHPTAPGYIQATASDLVSIPGTASIGTMTQGSVIFAGASGLLSQDNANLFWDNTNKRLGIGTAAAPSATLHVVQPVITTGSPTALLVVGGAHTTLTASAEASDVFLNVTRTVQFATGALATQRSVKIGQPTYGFVGASTLTDAMTVAILGAPIKGTNATVTRTHALHIAAGAVSTAAASYGLTVNAQTGATENYCAVFLGGKTGFGLNNPHAWVEITMPAGSGGNMDTCFITNGARTGVDADTETNTLLITTGTRQWNQGGSAFALQREVGITAPTYSFTSADTISLAATFHVGGAPIASTNATLTATHGIYVASSAVGAGSAASYGITVNTMTGGTANYCAVFLGGYVGINTTTPLYYLDVRGDVSIKAHAAFTGSESVTTTAAVQTTDNTTTSLWTFTLSDTYVHGFQIIVAARNTSGTERALWKLTWLTYREGGIAINGNVNLDYADPSNPVAWSLNIDTDGANAARVRVTGENSKTINWVVTVRRQGVSGSA